MEAIYTTTQNRVKALEFKLEGKESKLVVLQEKINQLKKSKKSVGGGSDDSSDDSDSNLNDYTKFLRRREKERQKRIKTPSSTLTTTTKSSLSYRIPDPKKFTSEKPNKYKGQKTRI